eukprot:6205362-Pleurochrysis_carterae.AAC.4
MPYWEGQSYGVIPPGINPKNGTFCHPLTFAFPARLWARYSCALVVRQLMCRPLACAPQASRTPFASIRSPPADTAMT